MTPPLQISDIDDPRLQPYRKLRERSQRADPLRLIAESEIVILRLLASGLFVESVVATPQRVSRLANEIPEGTPLYQLEPELLSELVGFDLHRGCVACAQRPTPLDLEGLLQTSQPRTVVLSAGLSDPVNVGGLARNCRAFGVDLLLLGPGADPFSRRAIRASMGNVFTQPLAQVPDVERALELLTTQTSPPRVLAATLSPEATPLPRLALPPSWVLLVGHEGSGLEAETLRWANEQVTVPVQPAADSLNVAAATAVLLYVLCGR